MDQAGEMWDRLELFLPDVVRIGETIQAGLNSLRPHLAASGLEEQSAGVIILGTVEGDIHDIGRNIVASLLEVNGFTVINLGHDVPSQEFVDQAETHGADIIGLSALMSTSMPFQEDVIHLLQELGVREKYKVMIGGGPVTVDWVREIHADGYGRMAIDAVVAAKRLMAGEVDRDGFVLEGGLA
jgi:methanogenic corrinoid protein MtbC1